MSYNLGSSSSSNTFNTNTVRSTVNSTQDTSNPVKRSLFGYTTDGSLLVDGSKYTGFYNLTNNNFYSGKQVTALSKSLTPADNITGNYLANNYYFNRPPTETLSLPYDFKDIKCEPSEYINQNSLNDKFKKLNDNFLQLFNFSFSENNDLPENFTGFIGCSGTSNIENFGFIDVPFRTINHWTNIAPGFNNVTKFEVMPRINAEPFSTPDIFLTIFASASSLYAFNCDNITTGTTYTFRTSTNFINGSNTRRYSNIADITTNEKDSLFVSDTDHNQIYRLYIDPLINDSRISSVDLEYLNKNDAVINTTGSGVLSTAEMLEYFNSELYAFNTGTKEFTVFNDDLTFNRKFTSKEIKETTPVSFAINEVEETIYALLNNFKIVKIPTDFKTEIEIIDNIGNFELHEEPKKIIFSKNDSNIFYVMTNNGIFKYYNTGSNFPVGKFNMSTTGNVSLSTNQRSVSDACILTENNEHDTLLVYNKDITKTLSQFNGFDKILRFHEKNSKMTTLDNTTFKVFDLKDILVTDEYFNSITFNKSLKKLIANLDLLASYMSSNFLIDYTDQKNLVLTSRATLSADVSYSKSYNMFVGSNEVVTPQAINRCLDEILKYQKFILNILQGRLVRPKYATTERVIINT